MQPQQPNNQPQPVPIQSAPISQPIQPVQPMLYGQPQPMMAQNIMVAQNSGNGASTPGLVMGILEMSRFLLVLLALLSFFLLFSWLSALVAVILGPIGSSLGS